MNELNKETWDDFVTRLRYDCVGKGVDEHCTADALFIVQAKRRVYGMSYEYSYNMAVIHDTEIWISPIEYWDDIDDDRRSELDIISHNEFGDAFLDIDEDDQWIILGDIEGHTVIWWNEYWEYVNSHLTRDAAEAFIKRKQHDYKYGLRIYVESQYLCHEFNAIKEGILSGRIGLL